LAKVFQFLTTGGARWHENCLKARTKGSRIRRETACFESARWGTGDRKRDSGKGDAISAGLSRDPDTRAERETGDIGLLTGWHARQPELGQARMVKWSIGTSMHRMSSSPP
jgi:hypothetical protein